jgi:nicotinamidase-related amidase
MTTLHDRPKSALLVIDVQNGVVADAYRRDEVIANINQLVTKAREQSVPVIWVQHHDEELELGADDWRIVAELVRREDEPLIAKSYGDAFEETDLEAALAERKVGRLVVTGAQTEQCIRSTLHGALVRGYDAVLVDDAHTTQDQTEWGQLTPEQVVQHTNLYWKYHAAPGRTGGTASTAAVELAVTV